MKIYDLYNAVKGRPAEANASQFVIWQGRMVGWLGKILDVVRFPGFIRPTKFYDKVTEQEVSVKTSRLFTIFSVGSRDYYSIASVGSLTEQDSKTNATFNQLFYYKQG